MVGCSADSTSTLCTVGEGQCTSNYDCYPGLRCAVRSSGEAVPGVDTSLIPQDTNVCYQATVIGSLGFPGTPSGSECLVAEGRVCQRGQGDCDSDSDCAGELRCFQREHSEAVPGVKTGVQTGISGHFDVCYDIQDIVWAYSPDANIGTGCTPTAPCAIGGADCDVDGDCYSGLTCFQRELGERVPGVCTLSGTPRNHDVCIASGNTA